MHHAAIRSIIARPPCLLIDTPKGSPACNECTGRASPYNDVIMNVTSAGPTRSLPDGVHTMHLYRPTPLYTGPVAVPVAVPVAGMGSITGDLLLLLLLLL